MASCKRTARSRPGVKTLPYQAHLDTSAATDRSAKAEIAESGYCSRCPLAIRAELKGIEGRYDVKLVKGSETSGQERYYPQFADKLRREAEQMADHYKIFYCLENFLRELITSKLHEEQGEKWWDTAVPEVVRKNAADNRRKEITSGNTPRSDFMIDYTNFGELGEIIKANWEVFGDVFRDLRAIENIMSRLNTLRGPIAHCKVLAEDEVVRLDLSFRDLFRQMGS